MVERVDKKYLENRFGDDSGNLYKASMGATLEYLGDNINMYPNNDGEPCYSKETNSSENDYSDLLSFLRILNDNYAGEAEFTAALENEFNVDGFLRYLAVTLAHSNLDVYMYMQQNFYLYNNPASGLFEWIPWDLNEAWGLFGAEVANESHPLYDLTEGVTHSTIKAPLYYKVVAVGQYRRDLAAYYGLIRHATFSEDMIASQAEELHNLIQSAVYQGGKIYVGPGSAYPLVAFDTNWQSDWGAAGILMSNSGLMPR
jgi:spore coat protein CotH